MEKTPHTESGLEELKIDAVRLLSLLNKKQPTTFGPKWIAVEDQTLYKKIKLKLNQKNLTWKTVINLLDETWKQRWREKILETGITLESAVKGLQTTLEKLNPETFGSGWIDQNDPRIYSQLKSRIHNKDGILDWSLVLNLLDKKWQKRWRHIVHEKGVTLEIAIGKLRNLLEKENPETFGPSWIDQSDPRIYGQLTSRIHDKNGTLDWSLALNQLDEKWKSRWKQENREKEITLETATAKLKALLEKENPEIFGPGWIHQNDTRIYDQLSSRIRNEDGSLNWSLVVSQLDEPWQKRWTQRIQRPHQPKETLKKTVEELQVILTKTNPETFGPRWIQETNPELHKQLTLQMYHENGKIDWSFVLNKLNRSWQKRWKREAPEKEVTLESAVKGLQTTLEKLSPESFGPGWIENNAPRFYKQLESRIRNEDGSLNWSLVFNQLDESWQRRWKQRIQPHYRPKETQEINATLDQTIASLKNLLEISKPETFGPGWIREMDAQIYSQLMSHLGGEDKALDWSSMLNKLDESWQRRWKQNENYKDFSLMGKVKKLAYLLEKNQPPKFTPAWLSDKAPYLYKTILKDISKGSEAPKWEFVIRLLDRKWQKRWSRIATAAEQTPKQRYQDMAEVETVLTAHKDKLYTFIAAKNEEDEKTREKICQELVRIARRGNEDALKQLTELLKPVLHEWFELNPIVYEDTESTEQIIKRCVYLFKGQNSFLNYLRASLTWHQLKFEKTRSLDQQLSNHDKRTLHDIIAREEKNEESEEMDPWL